jgi:hypothetical protein
MYLAIVLLTMLVLPLGSVAEHALNGAAPLMMLTGKWFVFWGVGARLGLAGLRQVCQPRFTARDIFRIEGDEALPLVRELGMANLGAGLVGLLSLARPGFVTPIAIWAALFYGAAGVQHVIERPRTRNEAIAMASDLWMFAILAVVAVAGLWGGR